jgi:NAD(P)-dependent dehydrogenase (short-subunit alcohol dehydrogenase family)
MSRSVLITGGTRGLGLALGKAFARNGDNVYLTHKWSSVEDEDIHADFRKQGLQEPRIIASDCGNEEDCAATVRQIVEETGELSVIVSNAAFGPVTKSIDDLKRSSLALSMQYTAWPVVELVSQTMKIAGKPPRHVLGISSAGVDTCPEGYDLLGASKAALEALCRYLAMRLRPLGSTVNVVRFGFLDTDSLRTVLGEAKVQALIARGMTMNLDAAAKVCVGLCSGNFDSMTGQIVTVDDGLSLQSPASFL